ncbi:hypothetical protein [Streptomyces odontomachi]|uniref:hypothetical protein n=1 Tax=Streptomyces odontomachi TaxID=2944940 RepID=UPI00210D0479|nr:hypothetical protein [Streptomyces sp. ODS25]
MWPGEQPPGGEQNPQNQSQNPYQQPGYQQPNPYQQPGYQQQNPYATQPGQQPQQPGQQPQWAAPTVPMGSPQPPRDDRKKTMVTALVAVGAVVVAAGVTGFLVLGGDKDDKADPKPSGSPSASTSSSSSANPSASASGGGNPRGTESKVKPTIPGWKVVVNPRWGTAFDVPPDWEVDTPGVDVGFSDKKHPDGSPLIVMSAPAYDKKKWCTTDDDHDGTPDDTALAMVGTKGQNGAKDTKTPAQNDPAWWVFGGYTDQKESDKKLLTMGKVKSYTTKAGIEGSVGTTYSKGVKKDGKCDSDGKATTFAFKNSKGDFVSWTFVGAKGVKDEVPEATVQKILSTVRLSGEEPTGG